MVEYTGSAPAGASAAASRTVAYDLPALEGWFDADKANEFYRDAGPGDHTANELKVSHPHAGQFYEEGEPESLVNFNEGTMQSAIAWRMVAGAVEAQPAVGELSRHMERYFEINLAWEIGTNLCPW